MKIRERVFYQSAWSRRHGYCSVSSTPVRPSLGSLWDGYRCLEVETPWHHSAEIFFPSSRKADGINK